MKPSTVHEPTREIPLYDSAEVLVVGGGSAGYCAALAAARHGAKTLLLERCAYVGGMSTGGFVLKRDYAGPLSPFKAIGGIPFEVWDRIEKAGGGRQPCPDKVGSTDPKDRLYGRLFTVGPRDYVPNALIMDPEVTKRVVETMLEEAGVKLLYNCWFADAIVEEGVVTGIIFECKEGRRAISADIVIDATGDGDVYARAGAEFDVEFKEATVNFRIAGVDEETVFADHERDPEGLRQRWEETRKHFNMRHGGWQLGCRPGLSDVNINTDEIINIMDTRALTRAAIDMRRKNPAYLEEIRETQPGFKHAYLVDSAPMVGCRASRRLKGIYQLNEKDIHQLCSFEDAIMLAACFFRQNMERFPPGTAPHVVAEVPYRCLVPETLDGLLAAGRCISCTFEALDWIRDLPFVMASGQAAGVAAAQCVADGVLPRDVSVNAVQDTLRGLGAPVQMCDR